MEGSWSVGSPVNICFIPSFAEIHGNGVGLYLLPTLCLRRSPEEVNKIWTSHQRNAATAQPGDENADGNRD